MGYHNYEFSLTSHSGDSKKNKAYKKGWEGSSPLVAVAVSSSTQSRRKGFLPQTKSFIKGNTDNIVLTVIKKGMDGKGYVLRWYEASDSNTSVELQFDPILNCVSAEEVNLMEESLKKFDISNNKLKIDTLGYEIKTVKIHTGK